MKRTFEYAELYDLYYVKNMTIKQMCEYLKTSNRTLQREIDRHGLKKNVSEIVKKHGLYKSRQYRIWQGMKTRCENKNDHNYLKYGAKGIKFDPSWSSFENFWNDMQEGYSDNLTLDRIDGEKGYCKENCRWVSVTSQNNNTKSNVELIYKGGKITPKEIIAMTGYPSNTVYRRAREGWSAERIINTPPLTKNGRTGAAK